MAVFYWSVLITVKGAKEIYFVILIPFLQSVILHSGIAILKAKPENKWRNGSL